MNDLEDEFAGYVPDEELDEKSKEWLQIRRSAALMIEPDEAEVRWIYARTLDPYGLRYEDIPLVLHQLFVFCA